MVTRDPAAPTKFLPAYDSGDHLHPGDAGYKAMGDAVDLALFWKPWTVGGSEDRATLGLHQFPVVRLVLVEELEREREHLVGELVGLQVAELVA